MRQKILCLVLLWLSLLAPCAHAEEPVATADTAGRHGTLYRIRHHGNTSWLFGTIHVGTAGVDPVAGEVAAALGEADQLMLEMDVGNTVSLYATVAKYGLYPPGDSIDRHLAAPTLERLRTAAQAAGLPWEATATMKPWLVANQLIIKVIQDKGYTADRGTDVLLLAAARKDGKPVLELESAEFQIGLFGSMSEAQQEEYLRDTLKSIESGKTVDQIRELYDSWARSDDAMLETMMKAMMKEKSFTARFTKREILDKRNPAMANGIDEVMKSGKKTFIAIGLLHLLGKEGVPALLKKKGYVVTKIY